MHRSAAGCRLEVDDVLIAQVLPNTHTHEHTHEQHKNTRAEDTSIIISSSSSKRHLGKTSECV